MPYASIDQLINDYLPETKKPAEIAAVTRILDAVSSFVDTYCRRPAGYFNPAGSESEKRVRGEGAHYLRLPVHVFGSITSVSLNGTAIDPATFYESEKNGWLYFEDEGYGLENSFYSDETCRTWRDGRVYKITARWGYEATPLDLAEAVRLTVLRVWETQKGVLGQITPNGFVIERAMPPLAKEILDRYKRREFEI